MKNIVHYSLAKGSPEINQLKATLERPYKLSIAGAQRIIRRLWANHTDAGCRPIVTKIEIA